MPADSLFSLLLQQGMVDNARAFLESDEGQKFEQGLQQEFLGNKQNAGPADAGDGRDSSDPSQGSYGSSSGDDVGPGSGGQGQDSTSGMNSSELSFPTTSLPSSQAHRLLCSAAVALQSERYAQNVMRGYYGSKALMSFDRRQTSLEMRLQIITGLDASSSRTTGRTRLATVSGVQITSTLFSTDLETYTAATSGGYGANETGDSFSSENQSAIPATRIETSDSS